MQIIARILFVALMLMAATPHCHALIMTKGLTKAQAEQELGVFMKRDNLGDGASTNDAGVSVEFSPSGRLANFQYIQLDVYSVFPKAMSNGATFQRRLTSATLNPLVDTKGTVRVFFTVDIEYLDRTQISIHALATNSTDPDGYDIHLNSKDFPPPQPNTVTVRNPQSSNLIKIVQGKFTGGIGASLSMDSTTKMPAINGTLPKSPAENAGLRAKDIILKVNGKTTANRPLKEVVDDLRGFVGTTVTLTIQRGGTNLDCIVHRTSWNNLKIEPPALWDNDKLNPTIPKR